MLIEKLKEISIEENWIFAYGKDHWQNLTDDQIDDELPFEDRKKYLKLLWKDSARSFDQYGTETTRTFTGDLLVLVRSKISDSNYEYKYEKHIANLEAIIDRQLILKFDICERFVIKSWRQTEVENVYDSNLDGLKISFTIDYEG